MELYCILHTLRSTQFIQYTACSLYTTRSYEICMCVGHTTSTTYESNIPYPPHSGCHGTPRAPRAVPFCDFLCTCNRNRVHTYIRSLYLYTQNETSKLRSDLLASRLPRRAARAPRIDGEFVVHPFGAKSRAQARLLAPRRVDEYVDGVQAR